MPGMNGVDGRKGQPGDKGYDCTYCPGGEYNTILILKFY
jgi:hypothetical protein